MGREFCCDEKVPDLFQVSQRSIPLLINKINSDKSAFGIQNEGFE